MLQKIKRDHLANYVGTITCLQLILTGAKRSTIRGHFSRWRLYQLLLPLPPLELLQTSIKQIIGYLLVHVCISHTETRLWLHPDLYSQTSVTTRRTHRSTRTKCHSFLYAFLKLHSVNSPFWYKRMGESSQNTPTSGSLCGTGSCWPIGQRKCRSRPVTVAITKLCSAEHA